MALSSAIYLFFGFPLLFLLYHLVPGIRGKNILLLVSSFLFYAFGGLEFVPLLFLSTLVNWFFGNILAREEKKKRRRLALSAAVVLNIAVVAVFKYADFFVSTMNTLLGTKLPLPGIPMPMGISFFTFTGIGYVVEAYRKPSNASGNFLDTALYISFFPCILAGPIVPWRIAEPQLRERHCTPEQTALGLRRFLFGLSKKLLVADILGHLVDGLFASNEPDARIAWLGAVGYAVQIYYDFSGYTDMALGMGQVFGFILPENFHHPYTALGMMDFWKRWHISLTGWFRNYVYMPVVMSRFQQKQYKKWSAQYGRVKANRLAVLLPTAVVWIFTGLWHGAAWSFVLWGLWQGLFCVLEAVDVIPVKKLEKNGSGRFLLRMYTALVILPGDILFRAGSTASASKMLLAMFTGWHFRPEGTLLLQTLCTPLALLALMSGGLLCLVPVREKIRGKWEEPAKYLVSLVLLVLCLMAMARSSFQPFIYQKF